MQHDSGQCINLHLVEFFLLESCKFLKQSCCTEKGMVHKVAEFLRMRRFSADYIQHIFFCKIVAFAQLLRNIISEQIICRRK